MVVGSFVVGWPAEGLAVAVGALDFPNWYPKMAPTAAPARQAAAMLTRFPQYPFSGGRSFLSSSLGGRVSSLATVMFVFLFLDVGLKVVEVLRVEIMVVMHLKFQFGLFLNLF